MTTFNKRTFSLPELGASFGAAALSLPTLVPALVRPKLTPALREEIMLGVTRVTDCRYCSWVHTGLALANGVDMDNLDMLLGTSLEKSEERDAVAILFGKHFADSRRRPSKAAREKLAQHFSAAERREVYAYIHAIYFANLTGNSVDAVLARLRGRQVEGSAPVQVLAAVVGAPAMTLIWLNSRRRKRPGLQQL